MPLSDDEVLRLVDKTAETLGKLSINAANADEMLFNVFTLLLRSDVDAAKAVYFVIEAFPLKRRMVERLAEARCDKPTRALVSKLLDAVKDASTPRNRLLHSVAGFDSEGDPILTNNRNTENPTVRVSDKLLNDAIRASAQARARCQQAFEQILASIHKPPGQSKR